MTRPAIIVHGGAWAIPDDLVEDHRRGCCRAARVGYDLLVQGHPSEDAVEAAVRLMEDDESFAGRGSFLNLDGVVELDAGFMEGADLNAGAVAGVRDIANPISLARLVMNSEHALIIGEGATRFAVARGLERCHPSSLVVQREIDRWSTLIGEGRMKDPFAPADTVGAVALDGSGHLAVAVSTGGRPLKLPGRVGDVPCVGADFYVDDSSGGAVSTGDGEAVLRIVMAKRAVDALSRGDHPRRAAEAAIGYLWQRVQGRAGLIAMDARGLIGCAFSTPRMARAWGQGGEIVARVDPDA